MKDWKKALLILIIGYSLISLIFIYTNLDFQTCYKEVAGYKTTSNQPIVALWFLLFFVIIIIIVSIGLLLSEMKKKK